MNFVALSRSLYPPAAMSSPKKKSKVSDLFLEACIFDNLSFGEVTVSNIDQEQIVVDKHFGSEYFVVESILKQDIQNVKSQRFVMDNLFLMEITVMVMNIIFL